MDTIGKRIRFSRTRLRLTQQDLASRLGISRVSVTQWESDQTKPDSDKYEKLAAILGGSAEWYLVGGGTAPAPEMSAGSERRQEEPVRPRPNASFPPQYQQFTSTRTIPLMGQSEAGANGRFIMNGQKIADVFCPPGLENVKDAYAVRVYGTSMEPRYRAGETVWLNPQLPVRAGDDVVVQLKPKTDGDEMASYIKEFKSRSSKVLRLWQHNPEEGETHEIEIDNNDVFSVHPVVYSTRY